MGALIQLDTKVNRVNIRSVERRYMGIEDFADYLGVPKGTLYVWVCQKKIPYLKIGKLLKFDLKEIEPWLFFKRTVTFIMMQCAELKIPDEFACALRFS